MGLRKGPKLTVELARAALLRHNGIVLHASKALKCDRTVLKRFMDANPELLNVQEEADQVLVDVAEGHMARNIKNGEMKTIRWYLERKAKDRGYTTRTELTGKDGQPVEYGTIERRIVDPANPDGTPTDDDTE